MKNILIGILCLIFNHSISQTVISYDYMETWTWPGYWAGLSSTSTWATNAFVSSNTSAVIYGLGSGNSAFEQDFYILPNVTGLDPNKPYQFRFRLASYRFTSSNTTSGVDVGDFVDVQISTDGEITYTSELRITGNNNAYWDYNNNGVIVHSANGVFNAALNTSGGDVYRSGVGNQQNIGYSVISLDLPLNITQVAVDIFCRVNGAGEEWWIDNIELVEINAMPVELIDFNAKLIDDSKTLIEWLTASENNCDYFIIEKSKNGFNWDYVSKVNGHGNSTQQIDYRIVDNYPTQGITYYRLTQVDFDGKYEVFNNHIRVIEKISNKSILRITNILGQEIDDNYEGIMIIYYDDNTFEKKYNKKLD